MNSPYPVTHPQPSGRDWRVVAVALAGFCTFLDLYATRTLLPLFVKLFHAPTARVSLTVSATTLAVALTAPFAGLLADRVGRKPVIMASIFGLVVPTALAATASTLHMLIFWRLLQGLCMPGIFAVTMAGYVTGNVLGGFCGRFLTGLIAEHYGWREAFVALAGLNLLGAVAVWRWLPPSRRFQAEADWSASPWAMAAHLQNPALLATYVVGFNILFSLVATFTYITFYLAAPPFRLGTLALGSVFLTYLLGAVVTPLGGSWIDRVGPRTALARALAVSCGGVLLTLAPYLPLVIVGLALCCSGVFVCQSAASSFVGMAAGRARSSATGLYVAFYYTGGSAGATLTGLVWARGGWPACVTLVVTVQAVTAALALAFWQERKQDSGPLSRTEAA